MINVVGSYHYTVVTSETALSIQFLTGTPNGHACYTGQFSSTTWT